MTKDQNSQKILQIVEFSFDPHDLRLMILQLFAYEKVTSLQLVH